MLLLPVIHINFVKCLFIFMTFGILVMSLLVNFFERYLPAPIVQTFRYGKFSYCGGKKSYINYLEVPKSWFKHFYVAATLYSVVVLGLLIRLYLFSLPLPESFSAFFDAIATKERTVSINATTAFLAVNLFCIQIWRRLHDTFMVSVFSNCKINVVHYLIGIAHYLGAATAIIIEAPGFATPSFKYKATLSVWDINFRTIVGIGLFVWAWYHQYKCSVILANLRKDEKGAVVTYEHRLPIGGLFDKISSPHMFCEMLMYFSLSIILWGHSTWPYVFLWVLCNQCETALLNHWWYKSTFKAYPKQRKAFLPFVM